MHSLTCSNGTTFHFNSDYSGNVIVERDDKKVEIDGLDFLEFARYAFASEIIELIENRYC